MIEDVSGISLDILRQRLHGSNRVEVIHGSQTVLLPWPLFFTPFRILCPTFTGIFVNNN